MLQEITIEGFLGGLNKFMEQKRLAIFSERFAILRGEQTQGEFAEFLGISRPTVGFYENGSRIPDALVLSQIAKKCNVSANWLLGLSDFRTEGERRDADDLYDRLMELMPIEFNEYDKRRVYRVLSTVIKGFHSAMYDYYAYTWYENTSIITAEALYAVASCMEIATSKVEASPEARNELFQEIDEILTDSATSAYRELGYFFNSYKKAIMEVLSANEYRKRDRRFMFRLDTLKNTERESGATTDSSDASPT